MARKRSRDDEQRSQAAERVPGLYTWIAERKRRELEDPRVHEHIATMLSAADRRRLNETSPVVVAAQRFLDRMQRREPIEVPAWMLTGHTWKQATVGITWLPNAATVIVTADDEVKVGQPWRRS